MREESHLDDMRSAIRGDFERLAERRGGQELMREPDAESDLEPETDVPEPADEAISEPEVDATPDAEPLGSTEPKTTPEPELEPEPEPAPPELQRPDDESLRRSFLNRLLGR